MSKTATKNKNELKTEKETLRQQVARRKKMVTFFNTAQFWWRDYNRPDLEGARWEFISFQGQAYRAYQFVKGKRNIGCQSFFNIPVHYQDYWLEWAEEYDGSEGW